MTKTFVDSGKLLEGSTMVIAPFTVGAVVTERTDRFLDSEYIESTSGVSITINKPTKYGSNPVFGTGSETWDADKNYNSVWLIGGTYRVWYRADSDDVTPEKYACYATSADGLSWSKPNLGFITYDGDTNNNILDFAEGNTTPDIYYDPDAAAGYEYTLLLGRDSVNGTSINIYTSANPTGSFTLRKQIDPGGIEGTGIIKRDDGRFVVYYQMGQAANQRAIGAYLTNTTALDGDYGDRGTIIPYVSAADQKYHFTVHRELTGEDYYGFMANYNSSTEQIHLDLYNSRDGLNWTLMSDQWVPLGSGGSWDDEMVWNGKTLVKTSNTWRFYYSGVPANHAVAQPRDSRVGYATIGYERIGSIGTTGNLVTDPIMPVADLHVNIDASGGSLKVELLNANDDSIVDGFSQDDFDTISSDSYDTTCQWGGVGVPIGKEIKLKFILSSATLYSYWVRS